jgi:NAD(P)-dependent dehydrogenase (short-subunit alcohol dehydrogenase family)
MSRYAKAHAFDNLNGPGDGRPTALQIVEDEGRLGTMTDKVFLVTGGSNGIGVETVRALHATGGTVFATGRDVKRTQAVIDEIYAKDPANKATIHLIEMRLDSLASVRAGAEEFLKKSDKLNVLVLNAGVRYSLSAILQAI